MKNTTKKIGLLLAVMIMAVLFTVSVSALKPTGQCGDNVYWNFDESTGELVISGEGDMWNFELSTSPFYYNGDIASVIVDDGVTSIGENAFYLCTKLTKLNLPDSLSEIRDFAFCGCLRLENVQLPNNLKALGEAAFAFCLSLKTLDLSENLTVIPENAFFGCINLNNIIIPENVTYIDYRAFYGCLNLECVNFSEKIESIGGAAFYGCISLDDINIPDSVTYIDDSTFSGCISLKDIILSKNLTTIGTNAFDKCISLEAITLPENLSVIDCDAFSYCISLKEIVLPEKISKIGEDAFSLCFSLEEIILPKSVTEIHKSTFKECYDLKSVKCLNKEIIFSGDNIFDISQVFAEGTTKEQLFEFYKMGLEHSILLEAMSGILGVIPDEISEVIGFDIYEYLEEFIKLEEEAENLIIEKESSPIPGLTLYGHIHSTTETYATDENIPFVVLEGSEHPDTYFAQEWTYDYDNMIRYRSCTYENCDVVETEELKTTTEGDVEIVEPDNPDTDFEVDEVEKNSDNYILVEEAIKNNVDGNFEIIKAFDINLKNSDGVHVQPDGSVKVKLPLDWEKDGTYKVYRVNDDGSLTDMDAYRQGSHLVFDTDHFSIYVIVVEGVEDEAPAEPEAPETPDEEVKGNFFARLKEFIQKLIAIIRSWFGL